MTNAKIKALVAKPLMKPVNCREKAMCAAIKTLLARQADVMEYMDAFAPNSHAGRKIRAILNPENET